MRMLAFAAAALAVSSTAAAATLPVRDGRYARPDVPCENLAVPDMLTITRGKPVYTPEFGLCRSQIVRRGRNVYVVTPVCTQDPPPVDTYYILSPTSFSVQNSLGREQYRWCRGF